MLCLSRYAAGVTDFASSSVLMSGDQTLSADWSANGLCSSSVIYTVQC